MQASLYMVAEWGNRVESVDSVTESLCVLLERLASIDPALREWRMESDESTTPFCFSEKRCAQRAVELAVVKRTGASQGSAAITFPLCLCTMNVQKDHSASIVASVGLATDNPRLINSVLCHLPEAWARTPAILPEAKAQLLVSALAIAWQADWACLTVRPMASRVPYVLRAPRVGLVTYLSGRRRPLPRLPEYVCVHKLDNEAHILALDEVFLSRSLEEYLERICEVHGILVNANVLLPVPLWPCQDPIVFAETVRECDEQSAENWKVVREAIQERYKRLGLKPPRFFR